ncbi:helix-turn-helix domain-containing protein [Larkinella humicola]|uniref:Helix-turn-helix domain-containing protein n=1 Tax=Larkinella humicola TaxID=2607654 RepID=A0A5N1JBE0_9BACT|nr:helix-turn-helix transcriptional regulator [Larkinella humicola]KAA9349725.1 helix-turn-helix domain-containing protein [Larkinella humicola]
MNKIYENIKAIRTAKGLTQDDISKKLGMKQSNYARVEKGLTQITIERLDQLAEVFEMSATAILSYEGGTQPTSEDVEYYIAHSRKLEKQVESLKKRVTELEEEGVEDWGRKNNELKGQKAKIKDLTEKIKEKDSLLKSKEKDIEKLDRHIQTLEKVIDTLRFSIEVANVKGSN